MASFSPSEKYNHSNITISENKSSCSTSVPTSPNNYVLQQTNPSTKAISSPKTPNCSNNSDKIKTEMCRSIVEGRKCPFGKHCLFAHSEQELRPPPLKSDLYKTQKCKNFHGTGFCPYGSRCMFLHDETPHTPNQKNQQQQSKTASTQKQSNDERNSRGQRNRGKSIGSAPVKAGSVDGLSLLSLCPPSSVFSSSSSSSSSSNSSTNSSSNSRTTTTATTLSNEECPASLQYSLMAKLDLHGDVSINNSDNNNWDEEPIFLDPSLPIGADNSSVWEQWPLQATITTAKTATKVDPLSPNTKKKRLSIFSKRCPTTKRLASDLGLSSGNVEGGGNEWESRLLMQQLLTPRYVVEDLSASLPFIRPSQ